MIACVAKNGKCGASTSHAAEHLALYSAPDFCAILNSKYKRVVVRNPCSCSLVQALI